jgi:hypothetical protein
MLGGELAVLQAPMLDGLSLDPFALLDDCRSRTEVGVGGRHIVQALVVTLVVIVFDKGLDLGLEVAGQEVGSGLIDQSQKRTMAARVMADMKA